MEEKELLKEKAWLTKVYQRIDDQILQTEKSVSQQQREMKEIRTSLWEDMQVSSASRGKMLDIGQKIAVLRQGAGGFGSQHQKLKQLKVLAESPYFGRMDFRYEDEFQDEQIYIGVGTLLDDNGLPMVYDWRAPVCSMFYDYGIGVAQYEAPGGTFAGEIKLKRQYRINQRELEYMFENELKIDDEVLQEALGRHSSQTMRNIVNTIQREQNQAIRNDEFPIMLVEGPAGSGKTSVALHRIAYLLYKYRDSITADNIVIFSPNQIFSGYISAVLPELGEDNVRQTTFHEYAERFLGWHLEVESLSEFIENILPRNAKRREIRLGEASYKSSSDFRVILDRLVQHIYHQLSQFEDIFFAGSLVMTKTQQQQLFEDNYGYLPIAKRLVKLKRRIWNFLRPAKKNRIKQVREDMAQAPEFAEESQWMIARSAIKQVLIELEPLVKRLEEQFSLNSLNWYLKLWDDQTLWDELASDPRPDFASASVDKLTSGKVPYEDTPALLYLIGELEGYPVRKDIQHVVIDEVQDYSPLQLSLLLRLFPQAKLTLVGDINQSVNPAVWRQNAADLKQLFSPIELGVVRLSKSYRSTKEIFRFCDAILDEPVDGDTVLRNGPIPLVITSDEKEWDQSLCQQVKRCKQKGYASIAIVCSSAQESQDVFARLKDRLEIELYDREKAVKPEKVMVIPVYLAKGLEFDAVIVPDASESKYGASYQRRLLYVVCSRALHELILIATGHLSPFIPEESQGLTKHVDLRQAELPIR